MKTAGTSPVEPGDKVMDTKSSVPVTMKQSCGESVQSNTDLAQSNTESVESNTGPVLSPIASYTRPELEQSLIVTEATTTSTRPESAQSHVVTVTQITDIIKSELVQPPTVPLALETTRIESVQLFTDTEATKAELVHSPTMVQMSVTESVQSPSVTDMPRPEPIQSPMAAETSRTDTEPVSSPIATETPRPESEHVPAVSVTDASQTESVQSSPEDLKQRLSRSENMLERMTRLLEKSQKYNEVLRTQIEQLSTELHAYRYAAHNRVDADCQVDEKDIAEAFGDKPFPDWGAVDDSAQLDGGGDGGGVSIADSLAAAAQEQVWQQAGFVYDTNSGLYYDHNSGYYYDHNRSLFYDPSTTTYFYYDETEQTYKFHSYATGSQQGEATTQPTTTAGKQATGETTDGAANTSSSMSSEKLRREKSHKHKHKEKHQEKPKIKKGKVDKKRRRKKHKKHKHRSKRDKKKKDPGSDSGKEEDTSSRKNGAKDSDKPEKKEKRRGKDKAEEEEKEEMEVDNSSDSLATGESEMESEPEPGELIEVSSSSSPSSSSSSLSSPPLEDGTTLDLCADPMTYDDLTARVEPEPEVAANYPPCIRAVVKTSEALAAGTFFLVPCPGGTLGRDDTRHVIQIPDVNISKTHAEIQYDSDNSCYTITDLGSQNGTFINDLRISQSKERSAAVPLCHGDVLGVAATRLLLHIHPGTDTCDMCEPGQVLAALKAQNAVCNDNVFVSKAEKKKQARQQLKEIKKKYGLANSAYVDNMEAINHPDYADKALIRRKYIGSEHDSHPKPHQPPASVHRPISADNKGHRMLARMGWKEGSGLGKDSTGRAEPVSVELRTQQTAGLGSSSPSVSLDSVQSAQRLRRLAHTQQRYQRLEQQTAGGSTTPDHSASSAQGALDQNGGNRTPSSGAVGGANGGGGFGSQRGGKTRKMQIKWIQGQTQDPT